MLRIVGEYMQDLEKILMQEYKISPKLIKYAKNNYIIASNNETYVLKRMNCSKERIQFIFEAKNHLINKGFATIDQDIPTLSGEPSITYEDNLFVLSKDIQGNECDFDNKEHVAKASILLANMHLNSKGFSPSPQAKSIDELGKLPLYFAKRLDELKKLKKIAKKGRNSFGYLFLENVDYYISLAEECLNELNASNYMSVVEKTKQESLFCHHDFTHSNIIMCDEPYLINFNYCCFEIKVYDIANFIRRKMRKCRWNVKEAWDIINNYSKVENITNYDFEVLKIILKYPQKFWRVANKYYNTRRSWGEKSYILKLKEVLDEKHEHFNFIKNFT